MNNASLLRLLAITLLSVVFFTGCAKAKHEKTIKQRYTEGATAICKDDFAVFAKIIDPDSAKNEAKAKITWGVIRLLVGLGKLTPEDFRIDKIEFLDDFKVATLSTSHREKDVWKKDEKPTVWILVNGQWHWKL